MTSSRADADATDAEAADAASGVRERARPLAPDERREAILDAVIPLLKAHGRDLSTRQIAEAAGVAEGTVFRAFGDKETLIRAAIEKLFDPLPFRTALRAVDHELDAEVKIAEVLRLLRQRFTGVFGVMAALDMRERPPVPETHTTGWVEVMAELFAADVDRLTVPVETLAFYLRLVAFSSALPPFNAHHPFSEHELARLVVHGVVHHPDTPPATPPRKDS